MGKRAREKASTRKSSSSEKKKDKYAFFKGKLPVLSVKKAKKKITSRGRKSARNPTKKGYYHRGYTYKLRDTVNGVK